jgi:hypothetical protein
MKKPQTGSDDLAPITALPSRIFAEAYPNE